MPNTFKGSGLFDPDGYVLHESNGYVTLAWGSTVPAAASLNYATGCVFLKLNGAAGSSIYINEGTAASSTFNSLGTTGGTAPIAGGATQTLTSASAGKTINLDTAAGSVITLPAATGSGALYRFVVSVLATSNSHIVKVGNVSDAMQGIILSMDDTAANSVGFAAVAGTDDTITLNRSTTGSVTIGEQFEIRDFAVNRFQVTGVVSNTGTPATMFSATV